MKLEKLPSIDDNCNQLEVAEYVDEIYQYYWVTEVMYNVFLSVALFFYQFFLFILVRIVWLTNFLHYIPQVL